MWRLLYDCHKATSSDEHSGPTGRKAATTSCVPAGPLSSTGAGKPAQGGGGVMEEGMGGEGRSDLEGGGIKPLFALDLPVWSNADLHQ